MKKIFLIVVILGLGIVLLWGCGGTGPGQPGSSGCEDFGLICSVTITPTYLGVTGVYNVDAYQDTCSVGPPPVLEPFEDHLANVAVSLQLINPTTTLQPPPLFIESYTIDYVASNDSIGAPPIQSYTGFISYSVTPPTGTTINTVTQSMIFVDIPRKEQYWQDVTSGVYASTTGPPTYINNYTAIYTIQGQIEGTNVTLTGTTFFSIGDYDNCSS